MFKRFASFTLACTVVTLVGCGEPPTTPTTPPASAPPGNTDGADTPAAPAQPGTEPTASTAPTAAPVNLAPTTLRGKVFDETGAAVQNASVKVVSLNPSHPFETVVQVTGGSYVVNAVPAGVLLEVTAMKDGWTKRSKVETLLPASRATAGNLVNFGGPDDAYFISRFPEIESVEPLHDARNQSADKVTYRMVLSEALDDANRRRLEAAIRLLPANAAARGGAGTGTTDLSALEDQGYPFAQTVDGDTDVAPYAVAKGSVFLEDANNRATVSWDAEGRVATLSFQAPMVTSKDEEAKYQVGLVSAGSGSRIVDREGYQLGTDSSGSLTSYPAAGTLILGTFKDTSLSLKAITGLNAGSREARWAATHRNVTTFSLAKDTAQPKLTGVESSQVGQDTRIALTFSEPMAAYNGSLAGFSDARLQNLANYAFAVGRRSGALEGVKLDGTAAAGFEAIDPRDVVRFGTSDQADREFKFATAALVANRQDPAATTGSVMIHVDPLDAKRVYLTILGRPNFFEAELAEIKARVGSVADPAGNTISASQADQNTPTGNL